MAERNAAPAAPAHPRLADSTRVFVLVIVVEIITIAGLYFFGQYFGRP